MTPNRTLIRIGGELDLTTSPWVARCLGEQIPRGPGAIHVDLSEVSFLGTSGLAALADAAAQARRAQRPFQLRCGNGTVRRHLKLAGLEAATSLRDA